MNSKIQLFRLLYNNSCGDYSFDDEFFPLLFIEKFQEKYGSTTLEIEKYFSTRNDPRVLVLYDSLKDKKEYITGLKVTYFPEELREYLHITIHEGAEYVQVDQLKLYRDFYNQVVVNNEPVEPLKAKYQRYEYVMRQYYKEIHKKNPTFEDTEIFSKFTPAEERRMADWKMFAELRKQFREKNPGPREDDFLDDEQWYCENAAEWGSSIQIPEGTNLLEFIQSK